MISALLDHYRPADPAVIDALAAKLEAMLIVYRDEVTIPRARAAEIERKAREGFDRIIGGCDADPTPVSNPDPEPRPSPVTVHRTFTKPKNGPPTGPEIKLRWRVRRINKGKPRLRDLRPDGFPYHVAQPVGWAVAGFDPDYDVVAQLDPEKPWLYRARLEDDDEDGNEVWVGGFARTVDEADDALCRLRLTQILSTPGVVIMAEPISVDQALEKSWAMIDGHDDEA